MKIVYFTHSLRSCWNHGNAHFLRGVLRDLIARGHDVAAYEPQGAWSLTNLLAEHGEAGLEAFRQFYPDLMPLSYAPDMDLEQACDGADLVIVHEWNEPSLVAAIGQLRARGAPFTLLFHDTHHRAVSDPAAMNAYALESYDGILAFGAALADIYREWGWGDRVFVWHEAADITLFHPPVVEQRRHGLIWVGNWGDDERTHELETFLLDPAQQAGLPLTIHGVRYPPHALALLGRYGVSYRGWLANALAPSVFARHLATVHVPRRFYARQLPGIPTIRVFEALFTPGSDFLVAKDGPAMTALLRDLCHDPGLRQSLSAHGLQTILARHSCAHRVDELLAVTGRLAQRQSEDAA